MTIQLAGATHEGKERDHNEDAFTILPALPAAIIADGMGGLQRGELASGLVVSTVTELLGNGLSAADAIIEAHRRIRQASLDSGADRMGTTAVVLSLSGNQATVDWVGDSRAYLWHSGEFKRLTRDHSFVEELVEAGAISESEAEHHPNRHVLTRAVGIRDISELDVDTVTVTVEPGDCLLLCTDGLYGYLPEAAIIECLTQGTRADEITQQLISRTLRETEAGDNVTAICAMIEG